MPTVVKVPVVSDIWIIQIFALRASLGSVMRFVLLKQKLYNSPIYTNILLKIDLFLYLSVCVYVCHMGPLKLKLYVVMSNPTWLLESKF